MPSPSKTGSGRYMAELPSTDGGYVLLLLAILDQAVRDARMRVRANARARKCRWRNAKCALRRAAMDHKSRAGLCRVLSYAQPVP